MSSLDKYGVPLPTGKRRVMGQPKPKNKFRVVMYGFGGDETVDESSVAVTYETDNVSLPKFNISTHELHSFDTVTNYGGKYRWGEQTLSIRDTIDNGPLKAVVQQIQRHRDWNRRVTARGDLASYKFEVWIQTLSGEKATQDALEEIDAFLDKASGFVSALFGSGGDLGGLPDALLTGTLNTWICTGCVITDVDFGSLDYTTSDYTSIDISFRPDSCVCIDHKGDLLTDVPGMFSSKDAFTDALGDYVGGILGDIGGSILGGVVGSAIGGPLGSIADSVVSSKLSSHLKKSSKKKIKGLF